MTALPDEIATHIAGISKTRYAVATPGLACLVHDSQPTSTRAFTTIVGGHGRRTLIGSRGLHERLQVADGAARRRGADDDGRPSGRIVAEQHGEGDDRPREGAGVRAVHA